MKKLSKTILFGAIGFFICFVAYVISMAINIETHYHWSIQLLILFTLIFSSAFLFWKIILRWNKQSKNMIYNLVKFWGIIILVLISSITINILVSGDIPSNNYGLCLQEILICRVMEGPMPKGGYLDICHASDGTMVLLFSSSITFLHFLSLLAVSLMRKNKFKLLNS